MIKTRALFCQTVASDTSSIKRFAGSIAGKVSQVFGRNGRAPKAIWEAVTRTEATNAVIQPRGLIAALHRGGQGVVRRYIANNYQSELVSAVRSRYVFGKGFRGSLGQRLATFGFVGVGVAAGAQWPMQSDDHHIDGVSVFKQVHDMFGTFARNKIVTLEPSGSFDRFTVEEVNPLDTVQEIETDFVLVESPSFVLIDSSVSDDSDISILSEMDDDQELFESNGYNSTSFKADTSRSIVIDESQASLQEELKKVLVCAEDQAVELESLRQMVLQLNVALHQLSGVTDMPDEDSYEPFEEFVVEDIVLATSGSEGLVRSVSLVIQQKRELESLRKTVMLQNSRLHKLLKSDTGGEREIAIRTAHCKRDACCGPGSIKHC